MEKDYSRLAPINLVKTLKADGVRPNAKTPFRPHVSVQGGGRAGIIGLGALDVFYNEGYLEHTSQIDGISIGTSNAAATISGQIPKAKEAQIHTMTDGEFVNFRRAHKPADFALLENVIRGSLDVEEVLKSPVTLGIGLTRKRDLSPDSITSRDISENDGDLVTWLMRAMHLPIAAGLAKSDWIDGGTSWLRTPDISRHYGATHIIDISNAPTKAWKYQKWPTNLVGGWLVLDGLNPGNFGRFHDFSREQAAEINKGNTSDCETVYPSEGIVLPGTFERGKNAKRKLELGFIAGQNAMARALGVPLAGIELPAEAKSDSIRLFGRIAIPRKYIPLAA
ncbi:MAG: hypothetical protein M3Q70_03965 [bacterium]|nr:hypothetical protein [bacterium]